MATAKRTALVTGASGLTGGYLPNAQLILYPDSSHGSQYQYPALFVADVARFLDAAIPFPTQKETDHA
jgi:pimeloyl-ACP methyl ester carboxylesterase